MSRDTRDDDSLTPDIPTSHTSYGDRHGLGEGDEIETRRPDAFRTSLPDRHVSELDRWSPARDLALPRSPDRRPVPLDRERYRLRGSETELLARVGAFRAIAVRDLASSVAHATDPERSSLGADLQSLRGQGLLHTHHVIMNGRAEQVAVLTSQAGELLDRSGIAADGGSRAQRFYAGLVQVRELAHNAQLYRLFDTERERLEAEGATVTRVVLDYELKGSYQRYVYERHQSGVDLAQARRAFADAHDLSFADERIHLPDVRVEYEAADGRAEHRDLELATEHYTRSQLGGKVSAGFRIYRAAGAGGGRHGGASSDPHHLEWIA